MSKHRKSDNDKRIVPCNTVRFITQRPLDQKVTQAIRFEINAKHWALVDKGVKRSVAVKELAAEYQLSRSSIYDYARGYYTGGGRISRVLGVAGYKY